MGNAISDDDSILQEQVTMTSVENSMAEEAPRRGRYEREQYERRRYKSPDTATVPFSSDEDVSFQNHDRRSPYSPETVLYSDDEERTATTDRAREDVEKTKPQIQTNDQDDHSRGAPLSPLSRGAPLSPLYLPAKAVKKINLSQLKASESPMPERVLPGTMLASSIDEKKDDASSTCSYKEESLEVIDAEEAYSRTLSNDSSSDDDRSKAISAEEEYIKIVSSREDAIETARRTSGSVRDEDSVADDENHPTDDEDDDQFRDEQQVEDENDESDDESVRECPLSAASIEKECRPYEERVNKQQVGVILKNMPKEHGAEKEHRVDRQQVADAPKKASNSDVAKALLARGSTPETDAETLVHDPTDISAASSSGGASGDPLDEIQADAVGEEETVEVSAARRFFPATVKDVASVEKEMDVPARTEAPSLLLKDKPTGPSDNEMKRAASPSAAVAEPTPSQDFSDIDLHFVEQYEATFDAFMDAHPEFSKRNPDLINTLRVAKLQKILETTATVESDLAELIDMLKLQKQEMTDYYYGVLRSSSKQKAAREIHLRQEIQTVEQATRIMEARLTWQFISKNATRAQKHSRLVHHLSQLKMNPSNPLAVLPDALDTQAIRDAVRAPANATLTEEQKKDLQQFQVDNAYLNAEVTVLEKKLAYQQAAARKHTWVDAVFRRMDQAKLQKLKERYQRKMGVAF